MSTLDPKGDSRLVAAVAAYYFVGTAHHPLWEIALWLLGRCPGVALALLPRWVHLGGLIHKEVLVLVSLRRQLLDLSEDALLTLKLKDNLAVQVLYVKVLSGHIRGAEHVLDVASVGCGLRAIACLVGYDVLPEGGRGELVLLGRIHDH